MEYLEDHGLKRVSKRLAHSGILDVVSTAIPGIRDVLVLGKVKQLERDRAADLILVDAPATGHAITFLTSASGLVGAARGGPLRTQAQEVVDLLSDPDRCRVLLVTLPETSRRFGSSRDATFPHWPGSFGQSWQLWGCRQHDLCRLPPR